MEEEMNQNYFHRVQNQSPTMFWINNPTRTQADWALAEGALGCTNNPSYTQKMLAHPEDGDYAKQILAEVLQEYADDRKAAIEFQARVCKPIADKFMPLWEKSGGVHGWVSIQGDPFADDNAQDIIDQAIDNRKVSPNICCKIPLTEPGLEAIEELIPLNVPINSTEIFGVAQMVALGETYEKVARDSGEFPMMYMSHIAGIYDDYLRNYVAENDVQISPDVLHQAGLAVARKVYRIMTERAYKCTFIGGGARGLHHFTEMVGGRVVVTINWSGTADKLLEQNPPVMYRLFNPVPDKVIDELMEKLPDFRRGYLEDGLSVEEFEDFGPVQLFKSAFTKSWGTVLDVIKEQRQVLAPTL
jgi:transaldolase